LGRDPWNKETHDWTESPEPSEEAPQRLEIAFAVEPETTKFRDRVTAQRDQPASRRLH